MDMCLYCNTSTCRVELTERAVVTACSHIFCIVCSESSGLSVQANGNRICPACQENLPNPGDVELRHLNPTEDYKASVLRGLDPTTIMECATRGIAFWVYQCTQEITLRGILRKVAEERYERLKAEMESLVNTANAELSLFSNKLSDAHVENERLEIEQAKIKQALIDKTRVHQQTLELYDRLKRKEITAATQSAALDSVDNVLDSMANRQGSNQPYQSNARPHTTQPGFSPSRMDYGGQQQLHNHNHRVRNVGSNSSNSPGQMMPPPPIRGAGFESRHFESGHNSLLTPSHHHTQFGNMPPSGNAERNTENYFSPGGRCSTGRLPQQTPSQRQPLAHMSASSPKFVHESEYGMSSGMRVGKQQEAPRGAHSTINQGRERPRMVHPLPQIHQQPHQPGDGFY